MVQQYLESKVEVKRTISIVEAKLVAEKVSPLIVELEKWEKASEKVVEGKEVKVGYRKICIQGK